MAEKLLVQQKRSAKPVRADLGFLCAAGPREDIQMGTANWIAPQAISDTGIRKGLLEELAIKTLFLSGSSAGAIMRGEGDGHGQPPNCGERARQNEGN